MSKDASHCQSRPHIQKALRETAAVSGGRATDRSPRAVGPLQLANSHYKQGPQDTSSPPTVTGTPPAMSRPPADIISFCKGHLLHLEGTKEPTRTHFTGGGVLLKVQLCSKEGKTKNL